jgi:hypothetical protein
LARELSVDSYYKTLIVDADIEAPGLTMMAEGFPRENRISYVDVLAIIHDSDRPVLFKNIAKEIGRSMATSTIKIPAKDTTKSHYFLPAYRMDYQLLDSFVHPEHIVSMPQRTFIISEFLSELGKQLKVDAVIIDLRAGLSELSAPILFDPRVRRIFVTSTSEQSTRGTKFILETIFQSPFSSRKLIYESVKQQQVMSPTILINMIPDGFEEKLALLGQDILPEKMKDLYSIGEYTEPDEESLSDVIIHSYFSDSFIHLENLRQICRLLEKTPSMSYMAERLAKRILPVSNSGKKTEENTGINNIRYDVIEKINNLASKEVTAEGTPFVSMMATESLENLAKDHRDRIPRVVILGAKGSGKTYIYKQLLQNIYWEKFSDLALSKKSPAGKQNTLIMPVLASANRKQFISLFDSCFTEINALLHTGVTPEILNKNEKYLNDHRDGKNVKQNEWAAIWQDLLLRTLSLRNKPLFDGFGELDSTLSSLGRRIVFIIDGLEDIFNQTIYSKNTQTALMVLCQDFINHITSFKNIGAVIFIRSDMAQAAIQQGKGNYEQFKNQHDSYMLKWSQDEALRLIIWILAQIQFLDYDKKKIKIPKLTHDALADYLNPFWGLKLGSNGSNEALSARWVIAALSDFNKQIQARDVIRFLKYATDNPGKDLYYHDRILLPGDIRKSIEPCSRDKWDEIVAEMKNLMPVLKKLQGAPHSQKELPLPLGTNVINNDERNQLETQGYLKTTKDGYYLPEIIRHALGYKYVRGGRPKVISLLIDSKTITG